MIALSSEAPAESYESDAIALSRDLAADHPVRAYVRRDTKQLESLAARPEATPLDRFLYAQSLAITTLPKPAFDWARRHDRDNDLDLPRLSLQLDHTDFSETLGIVKESQRNTLREMMATEAIPKIDHSRILAFETELDRLAKQRGAGGYKPHGPAFARIMARSDNEAKPWAESPWSRVRSKVESEPSVTDVRDHFRLST